MVCIFNYRLVNIYVSKGKIKDVVVDIRRKSQTYGHVFSTELDSVKGRYLYIPKGFAHGFLSLENDTIVNYAQNSCYSKQHDSGIIYNSIDFDWKVSKPIVSGRDLTFERLENFKSPF